MRQPLIQIQALAAVAAAAGTITFSVPSRVGTGGYAYAPLDPAPVGISFEFFAFPSYFTNVTATSQCLANWKNLTGVWPPIRIGGTTQDRASFDAAEPAYVAYSVASPADAPRTLTFGPKFAALAGTYPGAVVLGLNRGKDNLANTIAAAKAAVAEMPNLLAIELGNEPECEWSRGRSSGPEMLMCGCRLQKGRAAHCRGHVEPGHRSGVAEQLDLIGGHRRGEEEPDPGGKLERLAAHVGGRGAHRHPELDGEGVREELCASPLPGRQRQQPHEPPGPL